MNCQTLTFTLKDACCLRYVLIRSPDITHHFLAFCQSGGKSPVCCKMWGFILSCKNYDRTVHTSLSTGRLLEQWKLAVLNIALHRHMPARMCAGWKGHKVALLVLCLQYFFSLLWLYVSLNLPRSHSSNNRPSGRNTQTSPPLNS